MTFVLIFLEHQMVKGFFFILSAATLFCAMQSCTSHNPEISDEGKRYFNELASREGCLTYAFLSGGVSAINEKTKDAIVIHMEACNGDLQVSEINRSVIDSLAQKCYEECLNKDVFELVIVQVQSNGNTRGAEFEYDIMKSEKKVSIATINRY